MPDYDPDKWNDNGTVQLGNNCYDYAADRPEDPKFGGSQPGRAHGKSLKPPVSCDDVIDGARKDGFDWLGKDADSDLCPIGCWKVALVVTDDGSDYHWYRQDTLGNWSHKRGARPATNLDASYQGITNPRTADRNYPPENYSDWCGYFCVCPSNVIIASADGDQPTGESAHEVSFLKATLSEAGVLATSTMKIHLPPGLLELRYLKTGSQHTMATERERRVTVAAALYSGFPDPRIELSAEQTAELGRRLAGMKAHGEYAEPEMRFGALYVPSLPIANLGLASVVFDSGLIILVSHDGASKGVYDDTNDAAAWLLGLFPESVRAAVELVRSQRER